MFSQKVLETAAPTSALPLIDEDGEVGDLSLADPQIFRPAAEVLPPRLYAQFLALNEQSTNS